MITDEKKWITLSLATIIICFFVVVACVVISFAVAIIMKSNVRPEIKFSLINIEKGSLSKCLVDIRLPNRISEDEIKEIAGYIKTNKGAGCSPLFIFYYLPDEEPGIDTPWASSQYNPQLEVKINGLSIEKKAALEVIAPKSGENVIGNWLDTGSLPHAITIEKINGSYQITTKYSDGSGETKALDVKVINDEERFFENPGNYYGDYMVIEKNGNLAFYDNQGLIYELIPK